MSERDAQIVELTRNGLSARNVRQRLGLAISTRQVQRIAQRYLGVPIYGQNGQAFQISVSFMPYVKEALRRLGKDPATCEMCGDKSKRGCIIHHTKYEGCTIFDLMYICQSCNLARVNVGLT